MDKSLTPGSKWERTKTLLAWGFAVVSLALLLQTSLLSRSGADFRFGDFRFVYNGGTAWLSGESPYNIARYQYYWLRDIETLPDRPYASQEPQARKPEDLSGRAIMYPFFPNSALLAVPLRAFGWAGAKILISVLNLACTFALAILLATFLRLPLKGRLLVLGGTCLASATSATIFSGQLSLICTAGTLICLWAANEDRPFLAGVGAALALLKPQLSVLLIVVALLRSPRRLRTAMWTILLVGVTNLLPIILIRDMDFFSSFKASLALRSTHPFNHFHNMDGLYYALSRVLSNGSVSLLSLLIGLVATYAVARTLSFPATVLAASVISSICLPLHVGYDLVIVLPILILPFLVTSNRLGMRLVSLGLVVLVLRFPTLVRVLEKVHLQLFSPQLVLLGLLVAILGIAVHVGRFRISAACVPPGRAEARPGLGR